jgi:hypothetical protein
MDAVAERDGLHRIVRRRAALAALLLCVAPLAAGEGGGWDLPVLLKGEVRIPLAKLPVLNTLKHYTVSVNPPDAEMAARGGSGGPMIELSVRHRESGFLARSTFQAIYISVQDRGRAPPMFSVWTKTGANYLVYCRYVFIEETGEYCALFCEDYEVGETATSRTAAARRWRECGAIVSIELTSATGGCRNTAVAVASVQRM